MMGATFKYAAPLAGALGYSIEDTALAIGLMANAGIKGEQAGTSLRSMFTRLADPPKDAAAAIAALGLQMSDTQGNALPLSDVLSQLREKFAGLSQEQQIQMASSLAGQEAMSGLLAIVNASEADFKNLQASIANSDGAAKDMADTMNNNLKGRMVELGSGLEGLGIKFYDYVKEPLKEAAEVGIEAVRSLSASLSNGKLGDSVKNLGEGFKKLITTTTKLATTALPPLISALSWVLNNAGRIAAGLAAVKAGMAMYSVTSKAAAGYKAATVAVDALWAAAAKGASTTKFLTSTLSAQQVAVSALSGRINIMTAATTLATKAQLALKAAWATNPIGLAVTAVAALAAGLGVLYLTTRDNTDSLAELGKAAEDAYDSFEEAKISAADTLSGDLAQIEYVQNLREQLKELVGANGEVDESNRSRVNFILGELNSALGTEYEMVNGVIQNYDELANTIDKVIEKKKAQAILDSAEGVANEARENLKKEKDYLIELQTEYDELANKKRKNMAENARFDELGREIQEVTGRINEYSAVLGTYEEAMIAFENDNYEQAQALIDMLGDVSATANMTADEQVAYYQKSLDAINSLLANAAENGMSEATIAQLEQWRSDVESQLQKANDMAKAEGSKLPGNYGGGVTSNSGAATGAVSGLFASVGNVFTSSVLPGTASTMGVQTGQNLGAGLSSQLGNVAGAAAAVASSAKDPLQNVSSGTYDIGYNAGIGLANGLDKTVAAVRAAAARVSNAAVVTSRKTFDEHSPSKVMAKVGKDAGLGIAVGLEDSTDEVTKAAAKLAKETYEASKSFIDKQKYYDKMSLADELLAWQRVQNKFIEGSQQRIDAEKEVYRVRKELLNKVEDLEDKYQKKVESRAKEIAGSYNLFAEVKEQEVDISISDLMFNSAQQELQLEEWTERMTALMSKATELGLSDGFMEYVQGQDLNTLSALVNASDDELLTLSSRFENIQRMANDQATKELVGLREETDSQIAHLLTGVENQFVEQAPALGTELTNGLADGIRSGMSNVMNSAIAVARAAIAAAKNELGVHSPSKKFKYLGAMSGTGWAEGLTDCIDMVKKASQTMANSSLVPANVVAGNIVNNNTTRVTQKETVIKEKVVGIEFSGSGADLARELKPALAKEENISGKAIIKRNRG